MEIIHQNLLVINFYLITNMTKLKAIEFKLQLEYYFQYPQWMIQLGQEILPIYS